jgi:hypothetical protein
MIGALGLAGATIMSGHLAAAPPPPPPPRAIERATKIITPPAEADLSSYAQLFADNVLFSKNEKLVASGRPAWAAYVHQQLGLHHKVLHVSYGNPIMVTETLSNISYRGPNVTQDCCFWARVSFYHLRDDGKVDNVHVIENGSYWGPPEHPE